MGKVLKNKFVAPIVKWVGGKRQLIDVIKQYIPPKFTSYYEPFIGGGAVLFHLQPSKAIVNDVNSELINLYNVIKFNVDDLIEELHHYKNDEAFFYEIRELDRDINKYRNLTNIQRASRILFLNKTCYNGLFRVNSSGEFNTPFGRYKNPKIVDEITLKAVSDFFNNSDITLLSTDYEQALEGVKKGAFVYLDPPYDPISNIASFTGYDKGGFNKDEQTRLRQFCGKLHSKGVKFLLSNSCTNFINELYSEFIIDKVYARRAINSNADKRGEVEEVLVRNYE